MNKEEIHRRQCEFGKEITEEAMKNLIIYQVIMEYALDQIKTKEQAFIEMVVRLSKQNALISQTLIDQTMMKFSIKRER